MKKLLLAVILFFPALSHAELITFGFIGVSTACLLCNDIIPVGSPITGSYTFESTRVDSRGGDPNVGLYEFSGAPFSLAFNVLGFAAATDNFFINIVDGGLIDQYRVISNFFAADIN